MYCAALLLSLQQYENQGLRLYFSQWFCSILIKMFLFFFLNQGNLQVNKHSNEAVIMTEGLSNKDSGDEQLTNNLRFGILKYNSACYSISTFIYIRANVQNCILTTRFMS